MVIRNCQQCGEPLYSTDYYGTNGDGTLNMDYCSGCFKNGEIIPGKDHYMSNHYSSMADPLPLTVGVVGSRYGMGMGMGYGYGEGYGYPLPTAMLFDATRDDEWSAD